MGGSEWALLERHCGSLIKKRGYERRKNGMLMI